MNAAHGPMLMSVRSMKQSIRQMATHYVSIVALVGVLSLGSAGAAESRVIKPADLTRQEQALARDLMRAKIAASPEAKDALKKQVEYFVAKLTQPDENYFQIRKNIELMLAERNLPKDGREVIVTTLHRWAGNIAGSNQFSPSARINCVAILAELDEAPENARERTPPQPSKLAFLSLKKLAEDPASPYEVKAVAMHGLERQMRVYWPIFKEGLRGELQKLATDAIASPPKSELDTASHAWLVRRSYDMLAAVKVPVAADVAIAQLAEPKTLPSVRLSALSYLSQLDNSTLTPEQQKAYLVGLAHFLRSQLVDWYEYEEDVIKRDTNAVAGGMGGMGGMGMGGMEGGMGGMEGGMGGMEGGGYGEGMGGMGMGGGRGGMGMGMEGGMGGMGMGSGSNAKPIETQDWKTRKARRFLNMVTQQVHVAIDGMPLVEEKMAVEKPLMSASDAQVLANAKEMVELVDAVQTAINDANRIRTVNTLLSASKLPIEDIMDFVVEIPGFTDRYPELAGDDEKLEDVPEAPQIDEGSEPGDDGMEGEGAGAASEGGDGKEGDGN